MAANMQLIVFFGLLPAAWSISPKAGPFSLASVGGDLEALSVQDMERVFVRSADEHAQSMEEISKKLTGPEAVQVLKKGTFANNAELAGVVNLIEGGGVSKTALRAKQPSGYSGIDGARKLLNDMIYESLSKYDAEIAKCTDFYSKQCALMEIARGAIAASNFVAANSRMLILDSQAEINKCEEDIPETKLELKNHNLKCKNELAKLNKRLKIVMGDIAVMTMILKMTDCEAKLVQMDKFAMLRCENECTKKHTVTFNHKALQDKLRLLHSPVSLDLLQEKFDDMFDGDEPQQWVQLMQVDNAGYQKPIVNKTKFNNPPVPRTKVPGNPCNDPYAGAPSAEDKRAAKCTIKKSPQCFKLQSRFLAIQGGIADERDQLLEDISNMERDCEEQKKTLETSISNDQSKLESSQTKLAAATEKEANAGEQARQVAKQNEQYNAELVKQMKKCSNNYIQFETELCALKKIRGELYKMKGGGHSAFFQDCEVAKWDPEECTKKCAGGEQKLSRNVLTHPNGGTKCLPLAAMRSCNNQPCPVDCKLHQWSGWSKCSADCGGGVTQRVRDVKVAMKYNGNPCQATSQSKVCNAAACEKDCELAEWTKWTTCSKDCDGGTQRRQKFVKHPAEGSGKCADQWSKDRLEYKPCNMHRCKLSKDRFALECKTNKTMDIVLLIDTCPKTGKKAFEAEIAAANTFVDSFVGPGVPATPNMAVIQYCGPRTWSGVSKCTGKSTKKIDTEKVCHVKIAEHFTEDMKKIKGVLNGISYAPGTKLVSLALLSAQSELTLGRKEARSAVVAFIDGQPLSFRKTMLASRTVRKKARLLWVAVTKFAPLKSLKLWASRRWQENLVKVSSPDELSDPETVTHLVANMCPAEKPKLKVERKLKDADMALD